MTAAQPELILDLTISAISAVPKYCGFFVGGLSEAAYARVFGFSKDPHASMPPPPLGFTAEPRPEGDPGCALALLVGVFLLGWALSAPPARPAFRG